MSAIANGWAVPVKPGDTVVLPKQEFPAWPYGDGTTWEDHARQPRKERVIRPFMDRVFSRLDQAVTTIESVTWVEVEQVPDDQRRELVDRLVALRKQTDDALTALAQPTND